MTAAPATLEQIEQLAERAVLRLSRYEALRITELQHLLAAGASLTTAERAEVAALWCRYAQPALQTSAKTPARDDIAGDPREA